MLTFAYIYILYIFTVYTIDKALHMIYSVHLIPYKWVIFWLGTGPTHNTGAFADIGAAKDKTQAKKMSIDIHLVSFGWIVSVFFSNL